MENQNALGAGKVEIWQKIKYVKQEVLLAIHVKKWTILLQSGNLKTK